MGTRLTAEGEVATRVAPIVRVAGEQGEGPVVEWRCHGSESNLYPTA
jgi:hypothetical protein